MRCRQKSRVRVTLASISYIWSFFVQYYFYSTTATVFTYRSIYATPDALPGTSCSRATSCPGHGWLVNLSCTQCSTSDSRTPECSTADFWYSCFFATVTLLYAVLVYF